MYCSKHKKTGMINVMDKKCQFDGCNKIPNFNIDGKTLGIFCVIHKKLGMVDVKNRKCDFHECNIRTYYGFIGEQSSRCAKHKVENMITSPRKKCKIKGCDYFASYGLKLNQQEFCIDHKSDNYICLTNRKCKNAGKDPICIEIDILNDKGLCQECDPDDHFKFRRKAKEEQVKLWLDTSDHKDYVTYDKSLPEFSECFNKKYRPDFLYDCGTHYVVLEVDENQHRGKTYECDQRRMCDIAQSLGMPSIFIRYNPDEYKTNKRKYNPTNYDRKKYLMSVIKHCKEKKPEKECEYLQLTKLYFDGFQKNTFELIPMDIVKLVKEVSK